MGVRVLAGSYPHPLHLCLDLWIVLCKLADGRRIIAIMLGRLRMSIRDCIDAYIRLSDKVFKKIHYSPVSWRGRAQGRFDHKALETAIKDVVISAGLKEDALLKDDRPDSCKLLARLGIH